MYRLSLSLPEPPVSNTLGYRSIAFAEVRNMSRVSYRGRHDEIREPTTNSVGETAVQNRRYIAELSPNTAVAEIKEELAEL